MIFEEIVQHLSAAWLAAAILLGIAELLIPGIFLIFLAVAAAITGLALFALPELPLIAQVGSFAAWSIVSVTIGRRWYRDYPLETSDPMLNDRAARVIG
ncbi:MAG: NfeD family protein, partial [Proteobacteria bacterium]|nr:NfeD family protein [Pseudomonadota bacterium]